MLMEFRQDFNSNKYSRDVYSSLLGKEEDYLHSILIEKENTPHNTFVGVRTTAFQVLTTWPLAEWLIGVYFLTNKYKSLFIIITYTSTLGYSHDILLEIFLCCFNKLHLHFQLHQKIVTDRLQQLIYNVFFKYEIQAFLLNV